MDVDKTLDVGTDFDVGSTLDACTILDVPITLDMPLDKAFDRAPKRALHMALNRPLNIFIYY